MGSELQTFLEMVEEDLLVYKSEGPSGTRKLVFKPSLCTGCGLCLSVCPGGAISLGPVKEVISGKLEAPMIVIDESKCAPCPLCEAACLFGALRFEVEGEGEVRYPRIVPRVAIDTEKCIPCRACAKACPCEAIRVNLKVTRKDDLVKYETAEAWGKGEIVIDIDKCTFCGLCEDLCSAVKIEWGEPKPPDFKPGVDVTVDLEKCDFCGLCMKICPSNAISVTCTESAPRTVREPAVSGSIEILDSCIGCKICEEVCPASAIKIEKPFSGRVEIVNLDKCDPAGCKNCMLACPAKAVSLQRAPGKSPILIAEEFCIYCGACANACPFDVLTVRRDEARIEDRGSIWSEAIEHHLSKLLARPHPPPAIFARPVQITVEAPSVEEIEISHQGIPHEVTKKLEAVLTRLREKEFRIRFERGKFR